MLEQKDIDAMVERSTNAALGYNTGNALSHYQADVSRLVKEREELLAALNNLAAWDEGETVSGHFDNPGVAQYARDVLAGKKVTT